MKNPSILVTGGAGFIGAHVVRQLLQEDACEDCSVVVLDDLSGGFAENVGSLDRVALIEGSITDHSFVDHLFAQHRFDYVYHLAAYAAEGLSHFIRRFNYINNVVGSMNVLNSAVRHRAKHFVFTSSIAVYGSAAVPMREETTPQPEDPYGIAKYAVELDLAAAHELFGLNYTIFRPHNVYGEFQNIGDRYRNVVGIFMNRLMQQEPLPVFGDGKQKRAFTYVGDIAPAIAQSPFVEGAANQVFNVGSDTPTTVNELASVIANAFDIRPNIQHLEARHEVEFAWSDHTKSRDVFGTVAETPLVEGVRRMAEWAKVTGPRESKRFDQIEIERRLPPSWQL